jgi:hypothetical protein
MGDLSGLEEMNDNCGKVMYMGMMSRGFTVLLLLLIRNQPI